MDIVRLFIWYVCVTATGSEILAQSFPFKVAKSSQSEGGGRRRSYHISALRGPDSSLTTPLIAM